MLELSDGQVFYHGSYICVPEIDLECCRPNKDFGKGFYVTTSHAQAVSFARLSVKKRLEEDPAADARESVSRYVYHADSGLAFHAFEDADAEWLHFVASCRRGAMGGNGFERYREMDVAAGKVANDQTARTLQLYISGAYGEPGSEDADRIAIGTLLPDRLEDQYCFRTPAAVACLEFLGCEQGDG